MVGLGDIGPLAAKPVMEGKAVLFKNFAGIDVFEPEEPLPEDSPYRSLDNVILTPHSAWNTDGTVGRFLTMLVENPGDM